ncbi:type II toxin-antitoxin system RelE/ParE family toxin [Pelagicoccus albus]|uniref:Type II toxin-antitoxin system RelE/ParE family toxin n=1 Tax=Pelagicoccus albus TaxID=415222 RepID=A0A7X1B2P7_9BACT|nr:type II toxin-antitoxin system RelE/ParE family toxin [Pelagicoccus albus]MBC2604452.1 type II toxin-antitoxin system RelE/ParE family toxin [Pelagicoccus albus]
MARVIWAETALRDLESIAEYIELEDPTAAKRVVRRVFEKTDQLIDFPESGSVPKLLRGTPYRRLISKPVLIYYRIEDEVAYVVHIVKEERAFDLSRIVESQK